MTITDVQTGSNGYYVTVDGKDHHLTGWELDDAPAGLTCDQCGRGEEWQRPEGSPDDAEMECARALYAEGDVTLCGLCIEAAKSARL